jgi:hypothetical protein
MLFRLMPFTSLLTHVPANDGRILPSGYSVPSFETGITACSQNRGWVVLSAVDGQEWYGQSYEGGTLT